LASLSFCGKTHGNGQRATFIESSNNNKINLGQEKEIKTALAGHKAAGPLDLVAKRGRMNIVNRCLARKKIYIKPGRQTE